MSLEKMQQVLEKMRLSPRPSYDEVAKELGISPSTVSKWVRKMRKAGVDIPVVKGPRAVDLSSLK